MTDLKQYRSKFTTKRTNRQLEDWMRRELDKDYSEWSTSLKGMDTNALIEALSGGIEKRLGYPGDKIFTMFKYTLESRIAAFIELTKRDDYIKGSKLKEELDLWL